MTSFSASTAFTKLVCFSSNYFTFFRPETGFRKGHMQTVQTEFRRRRTRSLIRVNTVFIQEFLCKIQYKSKHSLEAPKPRNEFKFIRMDMSTGEKSVKLDPIIQNLVS